jgi:outer membrane receptor protein involved in Fe transport
MVTAAFGVDYLKSWNGDRQLAARAALSLADGRTEDDDDGRLPLGDWRRCRCVSAPMSIGAPGASRASHDRWHATRVGFEIATNGSLVRKTLDGYTTMDLSVRRRRVFNHSDLFVTIENVLDRRYVNINPRAFNHPEERSVRRRTRAGSPWASRSNSMNVTTLTTPHPLRRTATIVRRS